MLKSYDRQLAIDYANTWALARNPAFYDYSNLGGDCTNFISQCIYAGSGVMNYTRDYGWYYINANDKAPAWTATRYLYNFLTRKSLDQGPVGQELDVSSMEPGDIIQLAFQDSGYFTHSLFVVGTGEIPSLDNILINTHSYDRKAYPLSAYFFSRIRFIKIIGVVL